MSTFLREEITIGSEGDVKINLKVGYGQPASSTFFVNEKKIHSSKLSNVSYSIPAISLKGKTLVCLSLVIDVQAATNKTCIDYNINAGTNTLTYHSEADAQNNGDLISYLAVFKFI